MRRDSFGGRRFDDRMSAKKPRVHDHFGSSAVSPSDSSSRSGSPKRGPFFPRGGARRQDQANPSAGLGARRSISGPGPQTLAAPRSGRLDALPACAGTPSATARRENGRPRWVAGGTNPKGPTSAAWTRSGRPERAGSAPGALRCIAVQLGREAIEARRTTQRCTRSRRRAPSHWSEGQALATRPRRGSGVQASGGSGTC